MTAPRYSLSIDTGGTFTDGFVSDGARTAQVKVDTTPQDLTIGFAACVAAAAGAVGAELGPFLSALGRLHFSSTVATNTIVERRGAALGLIVTAGDEASMYGTAEQAETLSAFIDPDLVRGVPEEVDLSGAVVAAPDADAIEGAVRELLERGVPMLVLSFRNADLNPANEIAAREAIDRSYPRHYLGAVPLLIASRVSLAGEDFGRTATAVINAYLHPGLARALYTAQDGVRERGLTRPLLIVGTDGSTSRVAKTRAIDTYDSGPSAGVLGAAYVAAELDARCVCTFDVGGTTTDVACIVDGRAPVRQVTEAGPLEIPHPSVGLTSFGLGGGSIITVGSGGRLRVGPESTGAAPGPACFGLGGRQLTPTDLWLLLGYLDAGAFLGGRRQLDPDAATAAARELADALGVDLPAALSRAEGAVRVELATQLRAWADRTPALRASAPEDRWLFSYGGGGGLLCVAAAEMLGIGRVVVFPHSSVFSAFGAGLLPIAHAYQGVAAAGSGAETLARLADRARRDLRTEGVADLRSVRAVVRWDGHADHLTLAALLDDPAVSGPGDEATHLRLDVTVAQAPRLEMITAGDDAAAGCAPREVHTAAAGATVATIAGLGAPGSPGAAGPVFLAAPDTTIFVPAGWGVTFTAQGYGIIAKEST